MGIAVLNPFYLLSSLAPNYDWAISSVRKSLYSMVLASKAKKRVEI